MNPSGDNRTLSEIRSLLATDIPSLIPLLAQFHGETTLKEIEVFSVDYVKETLAFMLVQPGYGLFVAVQDGRLIGCCFGVLADAHVFLPTLTVNEFAWYVLPEHRQTSIGARLLQTLKAWGKGNGAQWIGYGKALSMKPRKGKYDEVVVTEKL